LDRIEFYQQELEILRRLGCDVTIATRWPEIPWDADLYFVWWWTWAFLPLLKARLKHRPVLVTGVFDHHWPVPGLDYDHRPWWQRLLLRLALRHADANVFVSEHEFHSVTRELGARNPGYVPLVLDTDLYAPRPHDSVAPMVMTVAWTHRDNAGRKCLFEIIRAIPHIIREHPQTRFNFIGEPGSAHNELRALVKRLAVNTSVEFSGVVPKARKIQLMQECSVYLQPSRYEGFGLAILEAMSCGAAVVSSPVGAVPEVVGDAGLLVDGRSPEAIATAVNQLLGDPTLRRALGERARQRAVALFPFERRQRELGRILQALGV
jgi:glycosyltransferase involved in cell wall biosynthesis